MTPRPPFRVWWPLGAKVLAMILVAFAMFGFYTDENPLHLVSVACFLFSSISFGRIYAEKRRVWDADQHRVRHITLDQRRRVDRVFEDDAAGLVELPPGVTIPDGQLVGDFTSDIQAELDRIDPPDHFEVPHTFETDEQWQGWPANTIGAMKVGGSGYTLPWALCITHDGTARLNGDFSVNDRPYGTFQLFVARADDGYHVRTTDQCSYNYRERAIAEHTDWATIPVVDFQLRWR